MDRGSALDGFQALYDGTGNAAAVVPQRVHTKVTVDEALVRRCQEKGDKPHQGTALGRLPELWPFDILKRPLLAHAELFRSQLRQIGYEPLTSIYEFQVWGPYMEKVGDLKTYRPEEGNHLIPKWAQRTAHQVWGYAGDEFNWEKGCAFIIVGEFTRAAKYGNVSEETGGIAV